MAKIDHLHKFKKHNTSENHGSMPRRHSRESFSRKIILTPAQVRVLDSCIEYELSLYNALVEHLYSRLKAAPDFFSQLTDEQIELFSVLVGLKNNTSEFVNKQSKDVVLPERLEPYRHVLFGVQGDKEIGLSDRLRIFYEICSFHAYVLADTREGMAYELLDFCRRQAIVLKQRTHDGEYKISPETLEQLNNLQKRHIQIRRDFVKFEWSEKDDMTKLWIPHLKNPILVQSDLTHSPGLWNIIIIHKDPNKLPLGLNIPWEIDFKYSQNRYLIKYLECKNPMSQMKSRFIGLRM